MADLKYKELILEIRNSQNVIWGIDSEPSILVGNSNYFLNGKQISKEEHKAIFNSANLEIDDNS